MGEVIRFPVHAAVSPTARQGDGRGTDDGQLSLSGQLSENHCIARSSRRTWMSAPDSIAANFLPSSKTRELTVDSPTRSISEYARATASSCSIPFMTPLSVCVPKKSTVVLPKAKILGAGYSTGMEVSEILEWIERRLVAKDISAARASTLAVGHPDAIRNMQRGFGKPKIETLQRLAEVLGDPPAGLLYGRALDAPQSTLPSLDVLRADLEKAKREVERLQITIETLEAWQKKLG